MKNKIFSIVLSVVMLMTCITIPSKANAQNAPHISQSNTSVVTMTDSEEISDYIKGAACRVFPEYESKIRADNILPTDIVNVQNISNSQIVIQETRAISDQEKITYTEYSNGISTLSGIYTTGKSVTNTQVNGPTTTYTFNAWLQILGSYDTMLIENIILGVAPNFSSFGNFGSVSPASSAINPLRSGYRQMGTLGINGSAYVEYYGGFFVQIPVSGGEINHVLYATMKIYADNNMQIAFNCY